MINTGENEMPATLGNAAQAMSNQAIQPTPNAESLQSRIERLQGIRETAYAAGSLAEGTANRVLGMEPCAVGVGSGECDAPMPENVLGVLDENIDLLEQAVRAILPHVERLARL